MYAWVFVDDSNSRLTIVGDEIEVNDLPEGETISAALAFSFVRGMRTKAIEVYERRADGGAMHIASAKRDGVTDAGKDQAVWPPI